MFNKLKFNNLVISSKKLIQKGRSQVVQKCVQKIRKLKQFLEKQPENAKHKQNLRKTLALMEHLKKLKCHDIIKALLLLEKKPTAILTNGRSSIEETATAMLSMNKILQNLLEKFKTELQLHGNDLRWRKVLQEQSKKKAKIARTEEKKRRRMELKSQKLITRKRQEWLESNLTDTNDVDETAKEFIKTTNGVWKEEKIEEVKVEEEHNNKLKNPEQKKTMKPKVKKLNALPPTVVNSLIADKPIPTVTKLPSVDTSNAVEEQIVDPFFITEKGDTYVATLARDVNNSENVENYELPHKRRNTIVDLQQRQRLDKYSFSNTKNVNGNKKMHPSWEARQRTRPVISKFQGKKISFESETKAESATTGSNDNEKLHPSWAAKQKMKPVIGAFQGKKIVFEMD